KDPGIPPGQMEPDLKKQIKEIQLRGNQGAVDMAFFSPLCNLSPITVFDWLPKKKKT
ncbi:UvrABC system protein A, partial [Clarias magur]